VAPDSFRTSLRIALIVVFAALGGCGKGVSTDSSTPLPGSSGDPCGNGELDDGEECDSSNLGEETCESLGHGPGMLSCDPVTCTYDTSMCQSFPIETGGTGGGGGGTGG